MAKRILVSGATGLIGSALVKKFAAEGHAVVAAVRNVEKARKMFAGVANVEIAEWDVTKPGGPRSCMAAGAQEPLPSTGSSMPRRKRLRARSSRSRWRRLPRSWTARGTRWSLRVRQGSVRWSISRRWRCTARRRPRAWPRATTAIWILLPSAPAIPRRSAWRRIFAYRTRANTACR